ncbi:MAG: MBL fold metallo-hydrolase [Spirochaetes bacterium]|nr:MBL fold metallo-hydrolase [Spirochaetota bacterium]
MKLFFQYCTYGFSNCYILGAENGDAIIIDPGGMDMNILKTIEKNDLNLLAALVTHSHQTHINGLNTLLRIYNVDIIGMNQVIADNKTKMIKDGDKINIGEFEIEAIAIPWHSSDSVVYLMETMLFTGDVLTAGLVGKTSSSYSATAQMKKILSRIISLPGDYLVFPGHGPPTTLEAERRFNNDIINFEISRTKKPTFRIRG